MFDKIVINNLLKIPIITETPTFGKVLHCDQEFIGLLQVAVGKIEQEKRYGVKVFNEPLGRIVGA